MRKRKIIIYDILIYLFIGCVPEKTFILYSLFSCVSVPNIRNDKWSVSSAGLREHKLQATLLTFRSKWKIEWRTEATKLCHFVIKIIVFPTFEMCPKIEDELTVFLFINLIIKQLNFRLLFHSFDRATFLTAIKFKQSRWLYSKYGIRLYAYYSMI